MVAAKIFLVALLTVYVCCEEANVSNSDFDEIKFDQLELFDKKEVQCIISNQKCTKRLIRIKETILKALKNGCVDCTDEEKTEAGKAVAVMIFKQPLVWKIFIKNHDNEKKFGKNF